MKPKMNFIWVICLLSFISFPLSAETISLEFRESDRANIVGFEKVATLHFLPLRACEGDVASVELPISGDISVNVFCAGEKYQIAICSGKGKNKICLPPKDAGALWYPQFASFRIPWTGKKKRTIEIKPGGGKNPKWIAYRFADVAFGRLRLDSEIYDFALYSQKEDGKFDNLEKVTFLLDLDKDGELLYSKEWYYPSYEIVEIAEPFQLGKSAFKLSPDTYGLKAKLASAKKGLPLTTGLAGSFAPQIVLKDLDGNDSPLFQSKAIFLYLFDGTHREQHYSLKRLEPVFEYFKDGERVEKAEVVGISLDESILQARNFARENNLPGRVLFAGNGWESEIVKAYHIKGLHDFRLIGADQKFWPASIHGKDNETFKQAVSFATNPESKEAQEYLKRERLKAGFSFRIALYIVLGEVEKAKKFFNELPESQPEFQETQEYEHLKKWLQTEDFEELSPVTPN